MTSQEIQQWWERSSIGSCSGCGRYAPVTPFDGFQSRCLLCAQIPVQGHNPVLAALSLLYEEKHPRKKPRAPKAPKGVILNPMLPARRRNMHR